MPSFKNGDENLDDYLSKNIKYPQLAKDNKVEGLVYLGFIIDKTGKPRNVKVLRGLGSGCDEEAKRVINAMPNWIPGKQNGGNVNVQFNYPVKFHLKR